MPHTGSSLKPIRVLAGVLTILACSFAMSACEQSHKQAKLDCENPVWVNEFRRSDIELGSEVCVVGYLAKDTVVTYLAAPGSSQQAPVLRRVILQEVPEIENTESGSLITIQGTLEQRGQCDLEADDASPDCWDVDVNFQIAPVGVRIEPISANELNCRRIDINDIWADPLLYSYEPVCFEAIVEHNNGTIEFRSTTGQSETRRPWIPVAGDAPPELHEYNGQRVYVSAVLLPNEGCTGPGIVCISSQPDYQWVGVTIQANPTAP